MRELNSDERQRDNLMAFTTKPTLRSVFAVYFTLHCPKRLGYTVCYAISSGLVIAFGYCSPMQPPCLRFFVLRKPRILDDNAG